MATIRRGLSYGIPIRCDPCRSFARSLPPEFLPDHELETRPYLTDRADLDVDEAEREGKLADGVFGDVGLHARRFLGPRDPDDTIRGHRLARLLQRATEMPAGAAEDMNESGVLG